jgi:hypothetical protein
MYFRWRSSFLNQRASSSPFWAVGLLVSFRGLGASESHFWFLIDYFKGPTSFGGLAFSLLRRSGPLKAPCLQLLLYPPVNLAYLFLHQRLKRQLSSEGLEPCLGSFRARLSGGCFWNFNDENSSLEPSLHFIHNTIFWNRKISIEPSPSITNKWSLCMNLNGMGWRQGNNLHLVHLEICKKKKKKGSCLTNLSFSYNKT